MRLKLLPKCLFALVCLVVIGSVQTHASDITKDEIKQIINESSDCDTLDQIAIDHLEFADLLGDGKNEAVVVGSRPATTATKRRERWIAQYVTRLKLHLSICSSRRCTGPLCRKAQTGRPYGSSRSNGLPCVISNARFTSGGWTV